MRDSISQTIFAILYRKKSTDRLIYSQFYSLIKGLFNISKTYIFNNKSLKNLALDPRYIQLLQQKGGSIMFSKAIYKFSYLYRKRRAYGNLINNQQKLYGIREEHRISLTMVGKIYKQWRKWDLYNNNEINYSQYALPYYIIPT